jgi:hypothetical protein
MLSASRTTWLANTRRQAASSGAACCYPSLLTLRGEDTVCYALPIDKEEAMRGRRGIVVGPIILIIVIVILLWVMDVI